MLKDKIINLIIIEKVAKTLEEINDDVIYVGGAIVSYYVTDLGAEQPRPTKDIDISVQISSYSEMDQLREKLESKGIYPAPKEKVMYRYELGDILIDFIPFEETSLGPTNSWLKPGFGKSYEVAAGSQIIKILPVSYFLATKYEAYKSRGKSDPYGSHDFEDIIYVLDNNIEVVDTIKGEDQKLILFIKEMAKEILEHPSRNDIIAGQINPFTSEERTPMVIEKLQQILEIQHESF